jgi:hypothetical protein
MDVRDAELLGVSTANEKVIVTKETSNDPDMSLALVQDFTLPVQRNNKSVVLVIHDVGSVEEEIINVGFSWLRKDGCLRIQ